MTKLFELNGGKRASFVDLIGNAVLISGLDISNASAVLRPGSYPLKCIPSLLHEADHFDAFRMPVGTALAILYLRAWSRLTNRSVFSGGLYKSAVDIVKYRCITAALAPLLEGFALYSEFDATPGESPATRTSTLLAALMFGSDPRHSPEMTVSELATKNLFSARCAPFFVSRKENLISQPFSTRFGGYLPGYYIVKNLFAFLVKYRGIFELQDGDLFIWVLQIVIMGDLPLARLILDPKRTIALGTPQKPENDAVNAPLMRIQSRLHFILQNLTLEKVKKIEKTLSKDKWTWDEVQLDCSPKESANALKVLTSETKKITEFSGRLSSARRQTAKTCNDLLLNRRFLCLLSLDATVGVKEGGRCQIGSMKVGELAFPYLAIPSVAGAALGAEEGTYEVYFDREDSNIFHIATKNGAVVAAGSLNPRRGLDIQKIKELNLSVSTFIKLKEKMERDIEENLDQNPAWKILITHYQDQSMSICEGMYSNYVSAFLEGEHKGILNKSHVEFGFVSESIEKVKFLSTYAEISLLAGSLCTPEIIEKCCVACNSSLGDFESGLSSWAVATGFPLVSKFDDFTTFLL